ncbi:MAG TPA: type 4a pilus biogenesis protein PilO [Acidobacteriota bacterium]|nr:type 4a pilus biogenesis protein PilO [Acidobacteriota bacterium]HNT18497.1 type 4a pilus biogenesis protein PilO [Acidobacteriota bacterium]HPA26657.1 type 4a pilus biogenesis protein PilO [Acidobacteriota bacterium]HQO19402.1 type 4a pilus biogenesis protein PilO [Acidobacteriota bacterium]HQQ46160.1 type 4a pilus biogenesis protein PilO [Acidobacteriota bacterium]
MEQLAKLPKAAQYIIAIVLGAAILAAGYFFIIQGQVKKYTALEKKSGELQSQIQQGKEAAKKAELLAIQIEQIKKELEIVKTIIPEDPETGKLLRVFQNLARDLNLTFTTISPKKITPGDLYNQQAYDIEVRGGYHQLAQFFDKLAHLRRVVNIDNLSIKASTAKDSVIQSKFQAIIYTQNPDAFKETEAKK